MEKFPSEYRELFEKINSISKSISNIYVRLANLEIKYGANSLEYNKCLSLLQIAAEREKELLKEVMSDSSVFTIFKQYISSENNERLRNKFKNDYDIVKTSFYAMTNDKYDELIEKKKTNLFRDVFLQREYQSYGKDIFKSCVFYLKKSKMYIKILDNYISNVKDPNLRRFLIYEKNLVLSGCKELESWYFGFNDGIDCMLLESDFVTSDTLDLTVDEYLKQLDDYFLGMCDDLTVSALESFCSSLESKMAYELNILASLLNMDALTISKSYKKFQEEVESNPYKYEQSSIDFVDDIYSKCQDVMKKVKSNGK